MPIFTAECVLCDWTYDADGATETPLFVYRAEGSLALKWPPGSIEPVEILLSDSVSGTTPQCALVAHWATAHSDQLRSLLGGSFEVSLSFMRPALL